MFRAQHNCERNTDDIQAECGEEEQVQTTKEVENSVMERERNRLLAGELSRCRWDCKAVLSSGSSQSLGLHGPSLSLLLPATGLAHPVVVTAWMTFSSHWRRCGPATAAVAAGHRRHCCCRRSSSVSSQI